MLFTVSSSKIRMGPDFPASRESFCNGILGQDYPPRWIVRTKYPGSDRFRCLRAAWLSGVCNAYIWASATQRSNGLGEPEHSSGGRSSGSCICVAVEGRAARWQSVRGSKRILPRFGSPEASPTGHRNRGCTRRDQNRFSWEQRKASRMFKFGFCLHNLAGVEKRCPGCPKIGSARTRPAMGANRLRFRAPDTG